MASIGPLSLSLQTPSSSCSGLLHRKPTCWKRPSLHIRGRFGHGPNLVVVCRMGSFGFGKGGILRKEVRVSERSEGIEVEGEEEEDGSGDEDDIVDKSIRAAINQSKKVLARQKDLLDQIVEKRRLVSAIKSTIAKAEKDSVLNEIDSSFQTTNQDSTSGGLDRKYSSMKSQIESPVSPPITDGKSLNKKEIKKSSQDERSIADALGLVREVGPVETVSPSLPKLSAPSDIEEEVIENVAPGLLREVGPIETVSPSLSKLSAPSDIEEEVIEDVKEANVEDVDAKQDTTSKEGIKDSPLAGPNVMNVILVAAECAPWSKTGGLGDVAGALPKALARRGHRVMVVAPRYGDYNEPQNLGVHRRYKVDGQDMEVSYFHAYIDGVDFVFIDSPIFRHRQNDIYGGNRVDILKRMVLFCKAAVEVPWYVPCGGVCYGDGNLVFVANDWHTALLPVYLKAYYRDHGLMKYTRSVLVIHNIAHQGRGPLDDFSYVDLPGHYMDLFKLYDPMGGEHFNIFAAGLKAADRIVTVSHGYAWELKTSEGGWGLHGIIKENDWKFQGIINGIDTNDWNPNLDVHLKLDGYANYSLETLHIGKPQCKSALQRELGLQVRDNVPVIGFIGRLDSQKGVDLIAEAMPWILGQDVQLVLLGTGRKDLEDMLRKFEEEHRDKVRGWVGFSVKMAHRITAGADILLMPSRFEPCGLNQLYAMMYGTIPVVHAVGGLRDTVRPFDPYSETGLGWTFDRAKANRLIDALGNCLNTYFNYKKSWEGLQRRGMMQDLSWDNAARQYEEVLVAAKYQW